MEVTTTNSVSVELTEDNIALVKLDMPGSSANVLTVELFAELETTFSELQNRSGLNGVVLYSAKPSIFVAGADLKRINSTLDWPDEKIIEFCQDGRAVMARLSKMPCTTVAAIHGACVGGGLEITLWCDCRIASKDRKTILGLPEVKLGLVPGWAGTVRLPRIASLEAAIDLVTSGRVAKADEALKLGIVEAIVDSEELLETAIQLVRDKDFAAVKSQREAILGPVATSGDIEALRAGFGAKIEANKAINPFACQVALDHMTSSAGMSHDAACHSESLAMAQVYGSEPSYGLLNNFFLGEHNKKTPGFVDVKLSQRPIANVGLVGCGLMGTSIAAICLKAGCRVIMLDADQSAMEQAQAKLGDHRDDAGEAMVKFTDEYSEFAECDLVVESVVEVTDVKSSVLERVSQVVSSQAIIATNTSAIPLSKLVSSIRNPERFCGLHFCHPELMQLVEVVKPEQASEEVIADVTNWIRRLRKMPVVVKDCAGFVVNRLLAAMLDQAFRLYSQGVPIREIDVAMRTFGFQGGPFEIVDVIGADTCMYAGREMYEGGVQSVTVTPVLPRLVKKGWLGRKSGQGFYRYSSFDSEPDWNVDVDKLLESYVDQDAAAEIDDQQIVDSICSCIVREAACILDEGIVKDPRDIDVCIINGFSFPAHVGGILFWADRKSIPFVNGLLGELAAVDEKLKPTSSMRQMQDDSAKFVSA